MQLWVEGAHDLLARAVLREMDGEWELCCPRELEATLYIQNAYSRLWERLPELQAIGELDIRSCKVALRHCPGPPGKAASGAPTLIGCFDQCVPLARHLQEIQQLTTLASITSEVLG